MPPEKHEEPFSPGHRCIAVLVYDDPSTAGEWLRDALGFTIQLRAGRSHAQLTIGNGTVQLTGARVEGEVTFRQPAPEIVTSRVHLRVEDVDASLERAIAAGAELVQPLGEFPFGERQCVIRDPGGQLWTLSQSVADVDPAEWGAS